MVQIFVKNLFVEVEDHALIGSKWSKQEVQSTRTLTFEMKIKLHWMQVNKNIWPEKQKQKKEFKCQIFCTQKQ